MIIRNNLYFTKQKRFFLIFNVNLPHLGRPKIPLHEKYVRQSFFLFWNISRLKKTYKKLTALNFLVVVNSDCICFNNYVP